MAEAASRELLRSEFYRTSLILFTALVLILVVLALFAAGGDTSPNLQARMTRGIMALGALAVYEGLVLVLLNGWRRRHRASPWSFRYLNTLVEVSLPALILVLIGAQIGTTQALLGAAPFLLFILIPLSALYLDFWLSVFAGLVGGAEFLQLSILGARTVDPVAGWEILTSSATYWIKSAILVMAGLAAGFVAVQAKRQMRAATRSVAERDHAVSMFGQHVSPQVAALLLRQPVEFGGEQRDVCVMFLDIRDFSRIAGERAPGEVVRYLNTLFGELIRAINRHQGIVNKFLGDGFMAVFGAPVKDVKDTGQAEHAVEASMEMLNLVETLNRKQRIPLTRIGIGLHLGEAVTGNVGSAERKEYTIIGDVVNLASRIEQATKQFDAKLLVSSAVQQQLNPVRHPAEDLGEVLLKGQVSPTRLFRLA